MAKHPKAAHLRLCVDRILPLNLKPIAAARSIKENPGNAPAPKTNATRRMGVSFHPLKMALETGKRWKPGRTLGIRFMDGSATQKAAVRKHANTWLQFADIKFNWNAGKNAQIRISFSFDSDSWSAVGTDCLVTEYFPKSEPTMNFGWLTDETSDTEYRRVVVHEFGHALGCIHEHQNPKSGAIKWNVAAVLAAYSGSPNNWSEDEIRSNIIDKYSLDQLRATKFDPKSIMLYSFPKELIKAPPYLAEHGTPENTTLSATDKSYIKKMYP